MFQALPLQKSTNIPCPHGAYILVGGENRQVQYMNINEIKVVGRERGVWSAGLEVTAVHIAEEGMSHCESDIWAKPWGKQGTFHAGRRAV